VYHIIDVFQARAKAAYLFSFFFLVEIFLQHWNEIFVVNRGEISNILIENRQ